MGLSSFGCGCSGLLGAHPPCTDSTQVKSFSTSASLIHVAIHSLHPSCIRVWYSQHAHLELKWLWLPPSLSCLLSSLASLISCRVSHVIHSCMSRTRSRIPNSRHRPISLCTGSSMTMSCWCRCLAMPVNPVPLPPTAALVLIECCHLTQSS